MSRSMRQRLLHIRHSNLSTLAVAPPATSRPVLTTSPRLPSEAPKQSQHSQLALSQPTPGLQPPLFPYTPPLTPNFVLQQPIAAPSAAPHANPDVPRAHKRPRLHYQLDVGAYGIPKQRPAPPRPFAVPPAPATALAVQVGEDAYFLRDNAMGVADGVGGWARGAPPSHHPTPSAMFARRLMHFCSSEIAALDSPIPVRPPAAPFSFEHHLKPPPPPLPQELEDHLDELADGIDVLRIMERAYDSTVRAHAPLSTGSSTALLAVLDHAPPAPAPRQDPPAPHTNYARGTLLPAPPAIDEAPADEAVVHIAHLGDCMGMLVRGDEIAWRSDEMWWGYNHPLQLGPPSLSSPSTPISDTELVPLPVRPHTFTLPVRADDILILASDGLGDNLWDEDVLDEVVRVRGAMAATSSEYTASMDRAPGGIPSPAPSPTASSSRSPSPFAPSSSSSWAASSPPPSSLSSPTPQPARRTALAKMIAEALCSRAKRASERRGPVSARRSASASAPSLSVHRRTVDADAPPSPEEVPFARRAACAGKAFSGGKCDDISVVVAVISPAPVRTVEQAEGSGMGTRAGGAG